MSGLLRKDFAILKTQKQFYLIIGIIGMIFLLNGDFESMTGAISYITMVTALSSIGTLSYDEFENGMPYLLTMPFTKREYVKEKFIFSFGITGFITVIFFFAAIIILNMKGSVGNVMDLFTSTIAIYLVACIFVAAMISVQLKYGSEKKQLIAIGIFLFVFAVICGMKFLIKKLGLSNKLISLHNIHGNDNLLFAGFVIVACIIIALLYFVAVKIIEKKGY